MKWNNKNIKPEYNRDILIKVESPCDMGYAYVSGFLNEDNDCYCET